MIDDNDKYMLYYYENLQESIERALNSNYLSKEDNEYAITVLNNLQHWLVTKIAIEQEKQNELIQDNSSK